MAVSPTIQNSGGAIPNMEDIRAMADWVTGANATDLTAATTLTSADHGKTFNLVNATGFAVTLPALKDGLCLRFRMSSTALSSGNHTVVSVPAAKIEGSVFSPEAAAVVCVAAADSVNFINATAVLGDVIELKCDGSVWHLTGQCFDQAGITSST